MKWAIIMSKTSIHGDKLLSYKKDAEIQAFHEQVYLPSIDAIRTAIRFQQFGDVAELFAAYRTAVYLKDFKKSQSNLNPSALQELVLMLVEGVFFNEKTRNVHHQMDYGGEVKLQTKTTTYSYADGSKDVNSTKKQDVAVFSKHDNSGLIVIECKTYIDSTMLSAYRDVCRTMQDNYPLCSTIVVAEMSALYQGFNKFSETAIDGVFILSSEFSRVHENIQVANLKFKGNVIRELYYSIQSIINNFPINAEKEGMDFREQGYYFKSRLE